MTSVVAYINVPSIVSNVSIVIVRALFFVSNFYTTSTIVMVFANSVGNYFVSMDAEGNECKSLISFLI